MRRLATPFLALAIALPATATAMAPGGEATNPGRAVLGTHPMCGTELSVTENALFTTGFNPDPEWDFNLAAGLWVGALVDRGGGPEPSVSTGLFGIEFFPVNDPPAAARPEAEDLVVDGFLAVMRDIYTPEWLPDHTPLGLEVVQASHVAQTTGSLSWVDVKFTVTNISAELGGRGLGWDLENVYLGILADPDVGRGDVLQFWSDDLGGFEPGPLDTIDGVAPGAVRGDLAYMFDEPGNGDDTDVQVGVALRGVRAHRFAIWSGAADDPHNDAERYALMRGNSDDSPTIDPPPTRSDDYRIFLSVGPIAQLAPGESTGFTISFVCGDLVPGVPAPVVAPLRAVRAPDLVVPPGTRGVHLAVDAPVDIWSVTGRRVATVPAGGAWDLRAEGARAPAGVYFYRPADRSAPAARIVVLR